MLREPVHHIAVVAGNTKLVPLAVADDVIFRQTILLAEIHAKLHSLPVHLIEIGDVRKTILANLKAYMSIVRRTPSVPATMIPRKRLISGDTTVSQLANEAVDADLPSVRLVLIPMVVALVLAKQTVVWTNIAFRLGLFAPVECTMMPFGVMVLPVL